jgi:hypothetical protein
MAMLKFKAPPAFSGKQREDAADWMELYETTAEYNRWGETEKRANFGMYLDGPARKWFQCLNPPALWVDTAAVSAVGGAARTAVVEGLRTVFLNEFLKQGHARHNEARLRKRRQGINEPAVEYYYDVVNLCRLIDPQMAEARKLGHLFDGLRPTLIEKIWMTQPKICEEFLTAARLLSEAAEGVGQGSWTVNLLAEEKEKQLQAMAAGTEKKGEAKETPTLQQLMAVMQQMQGELVALKRKQGRNNRMDKTGARKVEQRRDPRDRWTISLFASTAKSWATSEETARIRRRKGIKRRRQQ